MAQTSMKNWSVSLFPTDEALARDRFNQEANEIYKLQGPLFEWTPSKALYVLFNL